MSNLNVLLIGCFDWIWISILLITCNTQTVLQNDLEVHGKIKVTDTSELYTYIISWSASKIPLTDYIEIIKEGKTYCHVFLGKGDCLSECRHYECDFGSQNQIKMSSEVMPARLSEFGCKMNFRESSYDVQVYNSILFNGSDFIDYSYNRTRILSDITDPDIPHPMILDQTVIIVAALGTTLFAPLVIVVVIRFYRIFAMTYRQRRGPAEACGSLQHLPLKRKKFVVESDVSDELFALPTTCTMQHKDVAVQVQMYMTPEKPWTFDRAIAPKKINKRGHLEPSFGINTNLNVDEETPITLCEHCGKNYNYQ